MWRRADPFRYFNAFLICLLARTFIESLLYPYLATLKFRQLLY